jgi:hypothetical protein
MNRKKVAAINEQRPPFGIAIGCVLAGLTLAGVAMFLYQIGAPDVVRNDIVEISGARVERAHIRCEETRYFRTCWSVIAIETEGKHLELVQYVTPASTAAVDALSTGSTITALVSPISTFGNGLWFWEVRRGDEVLLSHEQTSKDELARNHRNRGWSYPAGFLAAVLLAIGAIVGIKQGVWRAEVGRE